ncbi:MAG: DISARM system helicase DrmA [Actinomycetota bacterium]|nr:DISARM system helicase DrmA [Actinomycetota bacterium]
MSDPTLTPVQVRAQLVAVLSLDLVGPGPGSELERELLPQAPSRWYLTGFLVPAGAGETQALDDSTEADGDQELEKGTGAQDDTPSEPPSATKARFPSSFGLSFLVPGGVETLDVTAHWGDYKPEEKNWRREPGTATFRVTLPADAGALLETKVPESRGLVIAAAARPVITSGGTGAGQIPTGTRAASLFLVNRRTPAPDDDRDRAFAFQAQLEVHCARGFVPRPDPRGLGSDDVDDRVADLQYRSECEFAVGHGIAAEAEKDRGGECHLVRTCWIPSAEVEHVAPAPIGGVELRMEELAALADGAAAHQALDPLVARYRDWIAAQRAALAGLSEHRLEVAGDLLDRASVAADRIAAGIDLLGRGDVLAAFRLANRAMGAAARRRFGPLAGKEAAAVEPPRWRPFQLAFVLMNLRSVVDPSHHDREVVDLLFFPTGGGKTEAYLGLAAFTLALRRLRNPGLQSAGVTVLMRYTLRLLTLDQLTRAATLICALELERQKDPATLGPWPFEIGLWVGRSATPNRMGTSGDRDPNTARARTIRFKNDDRKPSPIPLETCPWCGQRFTRHSFQLVPNDDSPRDLRINCVNRRCDFSRGNQLPILAVDEPIYRRLPGFLIATVDKFAAMPWLGPVGAFFGRVDRADPKLGFFGPCDTQQGQPLPAQLLPPDLVIQDELHLISGPMGTMVGVYEAALDALCSRDVDGTTIRPKIVASTATVRRAESQVRALFDRPEVDVFPPPGPDRRDSFFANALSPDEAPARLYLGIAAQGRSLKVVMLRTYLALMAGAQKAFLADGGRRKANNAADAYMTLVGYFNSLRELGGSRRIVEDEVRTRLQGYGDRKRVGQPEGLFASRKSAYEPVELTSRVSTAKVADAKRRLNRSFAEDDCVDVAIATNMISVGLDIVRLGLMVVLGQPKTTAEYIQATSRVGRDPQRPGLIVTLLNIHRPRDRSHYERFEAYHRTFYRGVEVTSVTPYSPRALDRGLAGAVVAIARHCLEVMTPPVGASRIEDQRTQLEGVTTAIAARAAQHARLSKREAETLKERVRLRVVDLLDSWAQIAHGYAEQGVTLQYQPYEVGAAKPLLHDPLDPELLILPERNRKFKAPRSMRDVEPSVNLWMRELSGGRDGIEAAPMPEEEQ